MPRQTENGFITRCSAHDDNNPSLSISETSDNKRLMKCFAGCTTENICSSINIQISDLFTNNGKESYRKQKRKIIEYEYKDETDNTIFKKVRVEPACDGNQKSFFL